MNKFQFLGRLTKEPEVRTTTSGTNVTIITLAVNRKIANKEGVRETDFFNITTFNKTAEFCAKYFKKGKQVLVEGRIQNRTWDDEKGNKRYATDFIAEQVYFADSSDKTEKVEKENEGYITIEDPSELPF